MCSRINPIYSIFCLILVPNYVEAFSSAPSLTNFQTSLKREHSIIHETTTHMRKSSSTSLMSLKPAAVDLLASGKAMANAGEILIDLTSKLDVSCCSCWLLDYYLFLIKHSISVFPDISTFLSFLVRHSIPYNLLFSHLSYADIWRRVVSGRGLHS